MKGKYGIKQHFQINIYLNVPLNVYIKHYKGVLIYFVYVLKVYIHVSQNQLIEGKDSSGKMKKLPVWYVRYF